MADLPKIRKGGPGAPGPGDMPAPPRPVSGMDLPEPAAPAKPMAPPAPPGERLLPMPPPAAPATRPVPMPTPGPVKGPPAAPAVRPAPVPEPAKAPPVKPVEPIKLPETGVREGEIKEVHGSPPVFIKIDKYSDIVKNLQKLKSYALSLRDALDALADIEKELTTGISIGHKALDDFNTIIAILDSKLLRASAIEEFDIGAPGDMDKYIKGIYDQMEKIKDELKEMT